MSRNLFFGPIKARLVSKLRIGDEAETRRAITHEAAQWADAQGYFPCWIMEKWPVLMATGHISDLKPHYRPGSTVYLGFPHWRSANGEIIAVAGGALPPPLAKRMAGRFLPERAATMYATILSAVPQRLRDVTEEQAIAELVEPANAHPDRAWYKDYQEGGHIVFGARESYFTMLAAVHHKPVPLGTWLWAYRFRIIERPEAAGLLEERGK